MENLANTYEQDFYLWICRNVDLLRQGRVTEIDAENIMEELDAMGKNQHRELVSRLKILFAHLLKWQFEPDYRSKSWKRTILEQRQQIRQLLETSPSLKHQMDEKMKKAYANAVEYAALETGIPVSDFPGTCPYSFDEVFDKNFYPEWD